jgi:Domain of unknown function (DUF4389)
MPNVDTDPRDYQDPPREQGFSGNQVWKRGLWMLVFVVLFELAKTVLFVVALVQFFWMLFAREKNAGLADFGKEMGKWLAAVALFQSGASDEKPFPWAKWGK